MSRSLLLITIILSVTVATTLARKCHSCYALYHESSLGGMTFTDSCSDREKWNEMTCTGASEDSCLYYSWNTTVAGSKYS